MKMKDVSKDFFTGRPFLLVLFLVLEIFIVLFFFNDYRRHDDRYKQQMMQSLEVGYLGATTSYDHATQMIFEAEVNKPEVLKLIASALDDGSKRDDYRNELRRLMLPSYERQKAIGILQLHFHLKDGTSFLRMHAPEKYGDNLFRRTAVYQVNKEQKTVKGYEVGYFADGYRFMYPLFYNGRHVGSVEFGVTAEGIISHLNQIYPSHYTFMINRAIVDNMTYAEWKKRNYRESGLSDDFMIGQKDAEDATVVSINQKIKNRVSDRLAGMERFVEKETIDGKDHLIVFLPVKDVTGKPAAYFVQYLPDNYSGDHAMLAIIDISLFTILLAGIFYSIDNIQSKRKSLEEKNEAVVNSENLLRTIINNEPECVKLLAKDGSLIMMNPAGLNMIQATSFDQVKDRCVYPLVSAPYRDAFEKITDDVFRGKTGKLEYEAVGLKGGRIWLDTHAVPLRNERGEIFALLGITRDITERKRAEEEREQFFKFFQTSSDLMFIADPNGSFIKSNPACSEKLGYSEAELVSKPFIEFVHPDDKQSTLDEMVRQLQKGFTLNFENRYICKDGSLRWLSWRAIYNKDEGITYATARDFTEQKLAETLLLESEQKYRRLFTTVSVGWAYHQIIVDENEVPVDYIFLEVNTAFESLTGLKRDNIIGKRVSEIFPGIEQDPAELIARYGNVALTGRSIRFQLYFEPVKKWFSISASSPEKYYFIAVFEDITQEKIYENETVKLNSDLTVKNREFEQILFATSHDLKTPLVNIHGFTKEMEYSLNDLFAILKNERLPDDVGNKISGIIEADIPESMKFIQTSIGKMNGLLDSLLKLSRLGRSELKVEELNMNSLIAGVLQSFEFHIKQNKINIAVSQLPPCRGDEIQIPQVFSNLIGNALKYLDPSRPGMITISGHTENGNAVYCVEDNGIGIAPEHQEKIFEMFYQLRPGEGEGIGLNIVQRIIERHNGRIWLESEPGTGSRFYVSLPV